MSTNPVEEAGKSEFTRPVIIKKIKKGHGGGHHGGAWKVAYADFVTAMMAFFMVLWLVAILSVDAKKAVAEYFRSYTIFKGTEAGGGKGISVMAGNPIRINVSKDDAEVQTNEQARGKLALELGKIIDGSLYEMKENILIFTTDDGIRIELFDQENETMFESGKTTLLPNGQKVLSVLAGAFKEVPYNVTIEGHTDATPYQKADYSNWELAADRANAARRELIRGGLAPKRVTKVTSFADAVPLNPDNPQDPTNRRVSILVEIKSRRQLTGDVVEFETYTDPAAAAASAPKHPASAPARNPVQPSPAGH